MSASHSSLRNLTLASFFAACLVFLGYLYTQAGGSLPGIDRNSRYTVSFDVDQVANLVTFSDVQIAGVPVGKVERLDRISPATVRVVMHIDSDAAPLRTGVTAQISEKSLAGQPVVKLVDGTGPPVPAASVLPASAVKPPVQLRDVLASLDKPTRTALGGVIRSMATVTSGRHQDLSALAVGLTDLGGDGRVTVHAVASQTHDLELISGQLNEIFDSLDVGQGQIAQLVESADQLSSATARQRPAIEASLRKLPGVLTSATEASIGISRLSRSLAPVAADLNRAAPDLNTALDQLPETSSELRGLLPSLHDVIDHAPPVLHRVPDFGRKARDLLPPAVSILRDVDPALRYLKPYGMDLAQFFANFGAAVHHYADDGETYIYDRPHFSGQSVRPDPLVLPRSMFPSNPYPAPGGMADLKPFAGTYPRVRRDR